MEDIPPGDGFVDPEAETPHYEEPHADKAELIYSAPVEGNVYKVSGIIAAAYIGGPIAGAALLYHNYKKFHQNTMAYFALASGFLIILFAVIINVIVKPAVQYSLSMGIVILITYPLWAYISQNDRIENCKRNHHTYSNWVAVGISGGIGIVTFLVNLFILGLYAMQHTPL